MQTNNEEKKMLMTKIENLNKEIIKKDREVFTLS